MTIIGIVVRINPDNAVLLKSCALVNGIEWIEVVEAGVCRYLNTITPVTMGRIRCAITYKGLLLLSRD